ncbi:MAG: M48 family metallopeptidase [Candidatus Cloacimonetes bacterium]|nr:M48 family metallopeptidase [Candidatus Cloacimonadota bacterium]
MWELIQTNRRRSIVLFIGMGLSLLLLGFFIGEAFWGSDGWIAGMSIAFLIWLIMSAVSYFSGDAIVLAMSHAKRVTPEIHPRLFNVVEEMKIAANLPTMPKVYIIPDIAPNAFATGRNPETSSVVVTAGLLEKLDRDELQGVIAHEVSHITNRDILFMTFSAVILGSIVFLSHIFLRSLWFGGGRRSSSRSSSKGGGQLQLIMMLIAILLAVLAPIMAQLLYFAISRKREYLADASAIRLTRYPEGLASALEKIAASDINLESANKATAGLFIVNPLIKKGQRLTALTSTHPPVLERIKILRSIAGGANYADYQRAYSSLKQGTETRTSIIPPSGIQDTKKIELTKPGKREITAESSRRKLDDLIRTLNDFVFLQCTCGLKIKIPPDLKVNNISCPRCGRILEIPLSQLQRIKSRWKADKATNA